MTSAISPLAANVSRSFFEAARSGRQILDLTHPLTMVLEKGADLHGKAAVAQADIKQYYDNLRPLLLARWLRQTSVDLGLCMTLLRMHTLPTLEISVGQATSRISGRCFGVLTGTRSAAVGGRVPLLDVAAARLRTWSHLSFITPLLSFCLGTFVDNLFATGSDPRSAVAN